MQTVPSGVTRSSCSIKLAKKDCLFTHSIRLVCFVVDVCLFVCFKSTCCGLRKRTRIVLNSLVRKRAGQLKGLIENPPEKISPFESMAAGSGLRTTVEWSKAARKGGLWTVTKQQEEATWTEQAYWGF